MNLTRKKLKSALTLAGAILALWFLTVSISLLFTQKETIISSSISRSVPTSETALVLPEGFTATPESFDGGEILYHLNISGVSQKVRGYFQIIAMGTDLEEYLATAEKYRAADIDTFKTLPGDRLNSVIWEYTTKESNVRTFFMKKGQRLYVLTLSADKDKVTMPQLTKYFNQVLNGLVI